MAKKKSRRFFKISEKNVDVKTSKKRRIYNDDIVAPSNFDCKMFFPLTTSTDVSFGNSNYKWSRLPVY